MSLVRTASVSLWLCRLLERPKDINLTAVRASNKWDMVEKLFKKRFTWRAWKQVWTGWVKLLKYKLKVTYKSYSIDGRAEDWHPRAHGSIPVSAKLKLFSPYPREAKQLLTSCWIIGSGEKHRRYVGFSYVGFSYVGFSYVGFSYVIRVFLMVFYGTLTYLRLGTLGSPFHVAAHH